MIKFNFFKKNEEMDNATLREFNMVELQNERMELDRDLKYAVERSMMRF